MISPGKRGAASRKGWRTRKRMQEAHAEAVLEKHVDELVARQRRREEAERALPNPFLNIGKTRS